MLVFIRGIQSGGFPLGPFCNQSSSGSLGRFFRERSKASASRRAKAKGAENVTPVSVNIFWPFGAQWGLVPKIWLISIIFLVQGPTVPQMAEIRSPIHVFHFGPPWSVADALESFPEKWTEAVWAAWYQTGPSGNCPDGASSCCSRYSLVKPIKIVKPTVYRLNARLRGRAKKVLRILKNENREKLICYVKLKVFIYEVVLESWIVDPEARILHFCITRNGPNDEKSSIPGKPPPRLFDLSHAALAGKSAFASFIQMKVCPGGTKRPQKCRSNHRQATLRGFPEMDGRDGFSSFRQFLGT